MCSAITEEVLKLYFNSFDGKEPQQSIFWTLTYKLSEWISSNLLSYKQGKVSWLNCKGNGCQWCRSDIIKALSVLSWTLVCQILVCNGFPQSADSLKNCIHCLHNLWAMDPGSFVSSIAENPIIQRRYIWSFKHITAKLKPTLGFDCENGEAKLPISLAI